MRSPIDMYILIAMCIKIGFGIFFPIDGIKKFLMTVGVGIGSLTTANFFYQLGDNCAGKKTSNTGRLVKSTTNALAQYFGGMLFTLLVVVIPIFRIPASALSKIPGSQKVSENIIWSIGVIITTFIINSADNVAKSKEEICDGTIGFGRIVISLIVFLLAGVYQYLTL
jgi:hypothetical protein